MKLSEFQIGKSFKQITKYNSEYIWQTTDVGTRVVIAICALPACRKNDWHRTPAKEYVINEEMQKECVKI